MGSVDGQNMIAKIVEDGVENHVQTKRIKFEIIWVKFTTAYGKPVSIFATSGQRLLKSAEASFSRLWGKPVS